MPAPYDTIGVMEDAIIERVKSTFQATDGRLVLRAVETLPGDWDDETLRRLLRAVPGAYVAFSGGPMLTTVNTGVTISATWVVYAVTGHASGEAARRRGDSRQVGGYEVVQRLVGRLHMWEPDPEQGPLVTSSIENLYTGSLDKQGIAVYAVTFKQELNLHVIADPAELADFETFDARLDVPPFANRVEHERWLLDLPTEHDPDARDIVSLPTAD